MDKLIKHYDFEKAKNELKRFSEQTLCDLDLKHVNDTKNLEEWFVDALLGGGIDVNHKVNGKELNELTTQINSNFFIIRNNLIDVIKEFIKVYDVFEALNEEYIKKFYASIKANEETSEGIKETQKDISRILENQKDTLSKLLEYKQRLDSYKHLKDIDILWDDYKKYGDKISYLYNSISNFQKQKNENKSVISNNEEFVKTFSEEMTEKTKKINNLIQVMSKKINYAYIIAGSSLVVALIELVIIILKVI